MAGVSTIDEVAESGEGAIEEDPGEVEGLVRAHGEGGATEMQAPEESGVDFDFGAAGPGKVGDGRACGGADDGGDPEGVAEGEHIPSDARGGSRDGPGEDELVPGEAKGFPGFFAEEIVVESGLGRFDGAMLEACADFGVGEGFAIFEGGGESGFEGCFVGGRGFSWAPDFGVAEGEREEIGDEKGGVF